MNEFRRETRYVFSTSALEDCVANGDQMEYQDRATDCVLRLWCIPGRETFDSVNDHSLEEQHCHREFVVPTQEGFPPRYEPSKNAIVYYENWDWSVDKWRADSLRASYVLETTRHVARRILSR